RLPFGNPLVEVSLADNFHHAVHLVMTQSAQFSAGNFVIADLGWGEVHPDCESWDRVLLEAHGWNEKAMDDVYGAKRQIDFAIDRHEHRSPNHIILSGRIGGVDAERSFVAGRGIDQLGIGLCELAVRSGIAEVPGKLHARDLNR